ncbi:MAG: membrane protein insertion efficiency factor YidD [Desulfobacterales bacterium]
MFRTIPLFLIRAYQLILSPVLAPSCRFYPTCSEYAYQAILRYGLPKGFFLALKRILKCHPFNSGGIDSVP